MSKNLTEQLRNLKKEIGREIENKLEDFKKNLNTNFEQKFLELCFCILVANTSIKKTEEIWAKIGRGFIYLPKDKLKEKLKKLRYRFYNKRTEYIVLDRKYIREISHELIGKNETGTRKWLVKNIKGIGWKEASHFLRNLGFKNFAILDRHVLKVLNRYKIINKIPLALSKRII